MLEIYIYGKKSSTDNIFYFIIIHCDVRPSITYFFRYLLIQQPNTKKFTRNRVGTTFMIVRDHAQN